MAAKVSPRSVSRWWSGVTVFALVISLPQSALYGQRSNAKYVGGTVGAAGNITRFRCKAPTGPLDATSDSNLVFGQDAKQTISVAYQSISSLKFGFETVRGAFCYPWDSSEQFTNKKHYLLTVFFNGAPNQEQAVVFELEKAAIRPTLARLEARSGKRIEFTNAAVCIEYRTADECGHGQASELSGLTKLFIETSSSAHRDLIASEIAASQLGLTVLPSVEGAEIVLRYK